LPRDPAGGRRNGAPVDLIAGARGGAHEDITALIGRRSE